MSKSKSILTAAQPSAAEQLDADLAHEEDILQRITEMRAEIVRLSDANGALQAPLAKIDTKLRDAQRSLEDEARRNGQANPFLRERIGKLQVEFTAMRNTFAANETRRVALNEELWRMQTVALPAARAKGSLDQVLAQQQRVAEAAGKLDRLKRLIAEQSRALEETAWQETAHLATQIEDLHAALAAGSLTDAEHEAREAQLTAERDEAQRLNEAAGARRDRLRGAIAGLERQAAAAEEELAAVSTKTRPALVAYLNAEVQRLTQGYEHAAEQITDTFLRLLAVAEIAKSAGSSAVVFSNNWRDMMLPAVYRQPDEPSQQPVTELFNATRVVFGFGPQYPDIIAQERERLTGLGVEL